MSRWCKKCGREFPVGIENEAQYIISETVSRCEFCSGRYAEMPQAKKKAGTAERKQGKGDEMKAKNIKNKGFIKLECVFCGKKKQVQNIGSPGGKPVWGIDCCDSITVKTPEDLEKVAKRYPAETAGVEMKYMDKIMKKEMARMRKKGRRKRR